MTKTEVRDGVAVVRIGNPPVNAGREDGAGRAGLADIIARNAPLGIQVTKEAGRQFIEAGERAAIDVIPEIRERVLDSEDAKEGIQSFVERRAAVFQGR